MHCHRNPAKAKFKKWHSDCREGMSHGVAAKLINVYLKARYLGDGGKMASYLHPPIYGLLIDGIKTAIRDNKLLKIELPSNKTWSKFECKDYEEWIRVITSLLDGKPLWKIEEFWPVHQ